MDRLQRRGRHHFLTAAPAVVMGRIDSTDVFSGDEARWPSGYILRLKLDGSWELLSADSKDPVVTLAAGTAKIDSGEWHRLELRFHGTQILASLDGVPLASVVNSTHAHGMIGLGTDWDHIQFDNLQVMPQ